MKSFFRWPGSDDAPSDSSSGKADEHASNPGADNGAASPSASVASPAQAAQADAARLALDSAAASPRTRGRPRKDGRSSGGDSRALQTKVDDAIAAQLDALHDPEAWAALLAMPGDVAAAVTGKDYWHISREERKTLGITGSAAARTMMITNPRALAFTMLASAMFSAYVPRMTQALQEMRAAKLARKKPETPDKA